MKISIITVCYNSSNTIEKTIKSVINQKNKNFEYIIIDGESSDDTLKIINKYKKFINKIISEKDNGIFEAMNKGIDFAKGDIIYFLNSDDFLLNNNIINKIQKIFEKNQLDAVFGGVLCFYPETNQTIPRNRKFLENNLKKGIMPPHQGAFIKKIILKKYFFDTKYRSSADFDFFCKLLKENIKFKQINQNIAKISMDGMSSKNISQIENELIVKKHFGKIYFFRLFIKNRLIRIVKFCLKKCYLLKKWHQLYKKINTNKNNL